MYQIVSKAIIVIDKQYHGKFSFNLIEGLAQRPIIEL